MLSALREGVVSAFIGAVLGSATGAAAAVPAEIVPGSANSRLESIVVTAKRQQDTAADEKLKNDVQAALHADPFFYDEHVTVTINKGVLTLHGLVFDDWDLRSALRIARRVRGVKRVINDLEIKLGGE